MQKQDKIFIIGAGAIGLALAVFIKHAGRQVVVIRGSVMEGEERLEHLSVKLHNGETIQEEITISTLSNYTSLEGIIVIATKSYGNHQLAERLRPFVTGSHIVILQNGLDIETPFIANGFEDVYRCVLYATCQLITPHLLQFKPVTISPVGVVRGNHLDLHRIIDALQNKWFVFGAEENIVPVTWSKAIINSVFNSVCPLLETDNGIFYRNEPVRQVAARLVSGCVAVAKAKGILLSEEKLMSDLLMISRASEGQLISTYQDILQKRPTEIATLNQAIANMAGQEGLEALVSETQLLGELVYIKSQLSMEDKHH